jgi:hypothetical protein
MVMTSSDTPVHFLNVEIGNLNSTQALAEQNNTTSAFLNDEHVPPAAADVSDTYINLFPMKKRP